MADTERKDQEKLEKGTGSLPTGQEGIHEDQEDVQGEQERVFVRERVLNRLENRRRWVRRGAGFVVSAVVFGVLSCLDFVFARPHME